MSGPGHARPVVSVVIANYNGASFLEDTLASTGAQTLKDIEVLVSDDGSTDGSVELITRLAALDPRIRLLQGDGNSGPAKARNRCLEMAQGDWVAILDSDDLMHSRRLEMMVELAVSTRADIVADNVIAFDNARATPAVAMLSGPRASSLSTVTPLDYVRANTLSGEEAPLGYLKPLIRRSLLEATRYDERLRIAEDYDLILRLLLDGARFVVHPLPLYFYRRHASSISHRLSIAKLQPMLAVHDEMGRRLIERGAMTEELARAFALRAASLKQALAFEEIIDAIRGRNLTKVLALCVRHPRAALKLHQPIAGLFRRWTRGTGKAAEVGVSDIVLAREEAGAAAAGVGVGPNESVVPAHPWPLTMTADVQQAAEFITQAVKLASAAKGPAARIVCQDPGLLDWAPFLVQPRATISLDPQDHHQLSKA